MFDAFYALRWPVDELARTLAFKKAHFGGSLLEQSQVEATLHNHLDTNWRKEFDAARDFGATGLVCGGESALPDALTIGQRLNVPVFLAAQRPCISSASLPPVGVSSPAILNKFMHWGAAQMRALDINERVVRFRHKLGARAPSNGANRRRSARARAHRLTLCSFRCRPARSV